MSTNSMPKMDDLSRYDRFIVTDSTGGSIPVDVDDWWMAQDDTVFVVCRLGKRTLIITGWYSGLAEKNEQIYPEVEMLMKYDLSCRRAPKGLSVGNDDA